MSTKQTGPATRNALPWLAVVIMAVVTGLAVFAWCKERRTADESHPDLTQPAPTPALQEPQFPAAAKGKKALYINAYHPGYAWSDVEQKAAESVFKQAGVEYQVFFMDTKRKNLPEEIKASAENARKTIDEYKPAWYRNTDLPFVFCGVNWDCGRYDLPCKNVTGMLEVSLIPQILDTVRPLAKGTRIALLGNDNETDHLEGVMIPKRFGLQWSQERYVKTFDEWKAAYAELQTTADIIFWYGSAGIKDWNDDQAKSFVEENTRIVTCSSQYYMAPFVLVGHMKLGEEQGDWAANAAVQILAGKSPMHIPVAQNKNARITLNMRLAKRLGVVFPVTLIEQAELIR
jgi:hypothetical protein